MLEVLNISRPPVLRPTAFTLPAGACGVITGASGSGKSLLARAPADLDPNLGDVRWKGASRNAMPAPGWRRIVGYVPAEPGWWAPRVGEHFPVRDGMDELLAALGLPSEAMNWRISRASTGERQRLALLRALAQGPQALILDEPTSALDDATKARVEDLLRKLMQEGMTILLITHDAAQAARLGERFWRMQDGELREAGT